MTNTTELNHLSRVIESLLISHSSIDKWKSYENTKSQVVKPGHARKLKIGDFTVSAAIVQLALPDEKQVSSFIKHLKEKGQNWALPIHETSLTSNGLLSIKLHRPTVFKKIVSIVIDEGDKYGHTQLEGNGNLDVEVLLNNATIRNHCEGSTVSGSGEDDVISLSALKGTLFCDHLKDVLQVLGFKVKQVNQPSPSGSRLKSIFQSFHTFVPISLPVTSNQERRACIHRKLVETASSSKYRLISKLLDGNKLPVSSDDDKMRTCSLQANSKQALSVKPEGKLFKGPGSKCVILDLRQYACDSGLVLGTGRFDKNIHLVKVTNEDANVTSILHQCIGLEEACQEFDPKNDTKVIHIVNKNKEHHQQQVDLAWRLMSNTNLTTSSQMHLVCGSVVTNNSGRRDQDMTVEEFYKLREAQTKEASVMKYGNNVKGAHWEEIIRHLTLAGIKFELLGTQLNNQVKLDTSDTRETTSWPDSRDGVFVMYNYARLATLFVNFEQEVNKGVYPLLPRLDSVDFSTLRENQEWVLLFNYALQYPSLLQDIKHQVTTNTGPKSNLSIHKICWFLVSLSRDLSSYYSHVHILGGGHEHLLPVMYARLYLMKAIQQVIKNGLSLLGIRPLEQM